MAYYGSIIKKELEYNGTRGIIPVASVLQNKSGLVHIWGRNDTTTTQDLGIHWRVYAPDGVLVEDYWDWSYGHGAGNDHEFLGGRFTFTKAGAYTMDIALSMNPSSPVIVATYYGKLCTVVSTVPAYPTTDIRNITISVIGVEYPITDIKNVIISVVGVEYPTTDIKNIVLSVVGVEYPITDIKNITINVVEIPVPPEEIPVPPEEIPVPEKKKFPWVPAALIAGGAVLVATSIKPKTKGGG